MRVVGEQKMMYRPSKSKGEVAVVISIPKAKVAPLIATADSGELVLDDDSGSSKYSLRRRKLLWRLFTCLLGIILLALVWWLSMHWGNISTARSTTKVGIRSSSANNDHGLTVADVMGSRTVQSQEDFFGHRHMVTPIAARQIRNYKQGSALIVNVHLTHHAGTYTCHALGKAPGQTGSPSFACMGLTDQDNVTGIEDYPAPKNVPWTKAETSKNIAIVRPHFHFLNWEFGAAPEYSDPKGRPPLSGADWENPNLVSIFVAREPISRLMAIDGWVRKNHPNILANMASRKEWMDYATTPHNNTNNFALGILAGADCCQGNATEVRHLVTAKQVLNRITFVLDIECLQAGLDEVAHLLGFEGTLTMERRLHETQSAVKSRDLKLHRRWPHPKERIPPKIYDFLVERNRLDIELYEWSKEISLVRCADIDDGSHI